MIGVGKTSDRRRRSRAGEPVASMAGAIGVSEPMAEKYARMVDLSPEPPSVRQPESEVLAPYEGTIVFRQPLVSQNSIRSFHTSA